MARPRKADLDALSQEEGNRRGELLRAAGRLFLGKGFAATTTRDIAEAAGMRSGSPFYHFRSKQDLLRAVMVEGLQSAYERQQLVIEGKDDPADRFRAMIRGHLQTLLGEGADYPLLMYEWRSLTPEARAEVIAIKDRYEAVWQRTIEEMKAAGLIDGDPKLVRLLVFGALNWTMQWYKPDGGLPLDDLADQVADLYLGRAA